MNKENLNKLLSDKEFLLKELKRTNILLNTSNYLKYRKNYIKVNGKEIVLIYADRYINVYTNEYDRYYSDYFKNKETPEYYVYKNKNLELKEDGTPFVFTKGYSADYKVFDKFFNYNCPLNKKDYSEAASAFFALTNKLIGNLSKYDDD